MSTLMNPSLLRTRGKSQGEIGPCFTLTGALVSSGPALKFRKIWARTHTARSPGPPQVPWGGFRKLWARIYADRSP